MVAVALTALSRAASAVSSTVSGRVPAAPPPPDSYSSMASRTIRWFENASRTSRPTGFGTSTNVRWIWFETRLIQVYGVARGSRIACVVRRDDPLRCKP